MALLKIEREKSRSGDSEPGGLLKMTGSSQCVGGAGDAGCLWGFRIAKETRVLSANAFIPHFVHYFVSSGNNANTDIKKK